VKTLLCYSYEQGDFWRGYCDQCTWNSKNLPFKTKEEAEHAVVLHKVVCKGGKSYGNP